MVIKPSNYECQTKVTIPEKRPNQIANQRRPILSRRGGLLLLKTSKSLFKISFTSLSLSRTNKLPI